MNHFWCSFKFFVAQFLTHCFAFLTSKDNCRHNKKFKPVFLLWTSVHHSIIINSLSLLLEGFWKWASMEILTPRIRDSSWSCCSVTEKDIFYSVSLCYGVSVCKSVSLCYVTFAWPECPKSVKVEGRSQAARRASSQKLGPRGALDFFYKWIDSKQEWGEAGED